MIEGKAAFHNDSVLVVHSFLFCPFLGMIFQVTSLYEYLCQMVMEESANLELMKMHVLHPVN